LSIRGSIPAATAARAADGIEPDLRAAVAGGVAEDVAINPFDEPDADEEDGDEEHAQDRGLREVEEEGLRRGVYDRRDGRGVRGDHATRFLPVARMASRI
jgi:hypothetical protein